MRLARPRGHYVVLVATLSIFVWFHNVMIFFLIEIDHNRWKLMNLIRIDQQLIKRWSDWSESIRIKRTFWVKRLIRTWKQSNFIKIDMVYQQMKISYLAVMEWILSVLFILTLLKHEKLSHKIFQAFLRTSNSEITNFHCYVAHSKKCCYWSTNPVKYVLIS